MKKIIKHLKRIDTWLDHEVTITFGDQFMRTNNYTLIVIFLIVLLIYSLIIS